MTEVLLSRYYDALEMDFSPRQSTVVNVDSDEYLGSPTSPLVSPLIDPTCPADCEELLRRDGQGERNCGRRYISVQSDGEQVELSVVALVLEAFKRTGFTCQAEDIKMDIGWPTNVRHVTHVTFDRFNGFLGLPVEFELEIPRRVPSASASVFGVSAESMQCSYDRKGNSVPTILLLLQERLYDQGGLKAKGVFRINAENSQEEDVRRQLNTGIVPSGIDVHCLAGLIKAWFRELPEGVLDSLSPEQVMQCQTEEQSLALVMTLPLTQRALLNWAVNLMADVVQEEQFNKMNARNIATVFAPNMTQMSDPLTALMHAVQVMNLLKTLILKTLRDREVAVLDPRPVSSCTEPPSGSGHDNATQEPALGVNGMIDAAGSEYPKDKNAFFVKTFNERESFEEYASARDSEEMFLRDSSTRETTDEDELSSDSRGPFSNGSSTMENTDDDSNSVSPFVPRSGLCRRATVNLSSLSISKNADAAGSSSKTLPRCNGKSVCLDNGAHERERPKIESELIVKEYSVQCEGLEALPSERLYV